MGSCTEIPTPPSARQKQKRREKRGVGWRGVEQRGTSHWVEILSLRFRGAESFILRGWTEESLQVQILRIGLVWGRILILVLIGWILIVGLDFHKIGRAS